ncbi:hypothetical protein QSH39_014820 [Xanthomonas arboricola pv. corylina]|uniref:hypothetical protein n=1 Tax=Xanthomonas arboricola TaxID=56448 RepID=UPI0025AF7BCA|nr:hypothetical protein [Xanthomonas arboricola]MDN0202808.1 hypothetical protein [Xanthomonas arboricola pv. corylina]MDN0215361.1 hypothetical protein [Xanthomonas arboricola pv. corylina]
MSTQSVKFAVARSCLMLPHPAGEEASISEAMHNIMLALDGFQVPDDFNDDAARQLSELREFLNTKGLSDPLKEGLHTVRARGMDEDQRARFSHLVDELAWAFEEYERENR